MNSIAFDVENEKRFSTRNQKFFRRYQISSILKKCNAYKEQGFSVVALIQYLFCLVADELADISFADAFEKLQRFLPKLLEGFVDPNDTIRGLAMDFIESLPAEVKQFLVFSGAQGISAPKMGCEV